METDTRLCLHRKTRYALTHKFPTNRLKRIKSLMFLRHSYFDSFRYTLGVWRRTVDWEVYTETSRCEKPLRGNVAPFREQYLVRYMWCLIFHHITGTPYLSPRRYSFMYQNYCQKVLCYIKYIWEFQVTINYCSLFRLFHRKPSDRLQHTALSPAANQKCSTRKRRRVPVLTAQGSSA